MYTQSGDKNMFSNCLCKIWKGKFGVREEEDGKEHLHIILDEGKDGFSLRKDQHSPPVMQTSFA